MFSKKYKVFAVIIAIVSLSIVVFVVRYKNGSEIKTDVVGLGLTEGSDKNVEIKQISDSETLRLGGGVVYPDLNRQIVFPSNLSDQTRKILSNDFADLVAKLKADPNSFENWSNLAIDYKIISDYEGVAEIFEFLAKAVPDNTVSRINLASLYRDYLRDYPKSERLFKEVLKLDSKNHDAYLGLFELYRYSYKKDTNLAETILRDGLKVLPEEIDFLTSLASYYKEKGRIEDARASLVLAREIAQKNNDTALVGIIDNELASLK